MLRKFFSTHRTLLLISFVILCVKIFFSTRDITMLIGHVLPDDAFYYFQIAKHIVSGHGSTFDGIHPTNGYHPLWMVLILPLFKFFSTFQGHETLPIQLVLIFSNFLDIVSGVLIALIIRHSTSNERLGVLASMAWWLNPFVQWEIFNGLETSLSITLLLGVLYLWTIWQHALDKKKSILIGVLFGLITLARMDMIFYTVPYAIWLLATRKSEGLKLGLISALSCVIVTMPWFIWNYMTFGMLFTSASVTSTIVNHRLVAVDNGTSIWVWLKSLVYFAQYYGSKVFQQTGAPVILSIIIGGVLFRSKDKEENNPFRHHPAIWMLLGVACYFTANALIRWTVRSWYFTHFTAIALIAIFLYLSIIDWKQKRRLAFTLMLLTLVSYAFSTKLFLWNREKAQREVYATTQWMNEHLPRNSIIGVFNAGIQGYFSRFRVINLDGLVNNRASEAIQTNALWSYALSTGITHLADYDLYLTYRYKPFFDQDPYQNLKKIHSVYLETNARSDQGVSIYEVTR